MKYITCVSIAILHCLQGFVPALAQTAAPRLSIQALANQKVVVTWTNDGRGVVLEQAAFIGSPTLWRPIQQIPLEQNNQFSVSVDTSLGNGFFRLHTPQLTSVRESSPVNGETGVAVIRETIVHFSAALSTNAVVTTNNFYAGYGGRRLLSRVELSSDRTKATLFYLEPMPGSTRVVAVFDGTGLTDFLGRPLDADGDGQAGGAQLIAFDTLNLTALAGTAVIGTVYASELAPGSDTGTNAVNKPLAGVTITVDGMEQTLRAETDASGNFKLEPAPPGRFFVHIDGRTVTNLAAGIRYPNLAYYPFVGKAWEAVAGRTDNPAGGTGKIYLPLITAGTLQPVSMASDTLIGFPSSVVSSNPALAGVSITVPANSLFADDGTRGGKVGIAPVPPDRLPGPLPPGLEPPIVITVQTDGPLNFDKPAPVCFPNLPDPVLGAPLLGGSKQMLISFNHKKGIWEAVGDMTVSADGKFICTDPGSGILQPGWHGVGPQPDKPKPCSNCCPIGGGGGPQSFSLQSATVGGQSIRPGSVSLQDFTLQCKPCTRDPTLLSACLKDTAKRFKKCFDDGYKEYVRCRKRCKQLYKKGSQYGACIGDSGCTGRGFRDRFNCDDEGTDGTNKCNTCYSPPLFPASESNASPLLPSRKLGLANPPSVRDQIIDLVDQALNLESALYAPDAPPVTSAMDAQVQALLDQADRLAGGDAEQFLSDDSKGIDGTFDGAAARIDSTPDEVPPYPVLFAAEIQRPDGIFVIRGETGPFGDYALFVPRDGELLSVSFYDPHTKRYDVVHPDPDPNAPYRLSQFNLVPMGPSMPDTDHDGLADIAELVFGTAPTKADTDGDGVPDGAEVEQGTDPLDGRPTQTGIIATAKTPGPAVDICAVNNLAMLAEGTNGVSVFNVFAGQNPTLMAQVGTPGFAQRIACGGDLVAVADGSAGLSVIDISSPAAARVAWQVSLGANAQSVAVAGNLAYMGLDSGDIVTVDMLTGTVLDRVSVGAGAAVQDLALGSEFLYALTVDRLISLSLLNGLLSVAGSTNSPYFAAPNARLFVGGDIAYAVHNKGYNTLSLTNPSQPALIAAANTTQFGWKQIAPNGSGLGVAAVSPILAFENPATHNVSLYDLKDPTKTDGFLTEFPTPGFARAVSIFNGLAYVADDFAGLQVINYLAYDAKGIPPAITLTTSFPTNGVEEGKPARVTANVTDDVQVRNVEFYIDGVKVVTDGNFPFEHRFAAPLLAFVRTSFRLRALATDTGGNSTWSDELVVPLQPDRTPPKILRLLPGDGAVFLTNSLVHFSARMSEAINRGTWNATSVQVFSAGSDGLAGTSDDVPVTGAALSYRDDLSTAFLDFNPPMPAGVYRVVVSAPLADLAGNALAAPVVWTFRVVNTFTITYSRAGSPEDTIWLAGGDGSFDQQITTGEHPRLSLDGKYLLFLRGGGSGNYARGSMFVRDLQTTNETQIFNNNFDYVVYFDWQADSTRIVFDYSCSIYTMNRDGTPNPAPRFIQQSGCYDDAPAINQVDGRVAFHNQSGLRLVDAGGGGQMSIPNTQPGDYWAAWSPDGQWVSFLRSSTTNYFKVRPDGSGLTQLTALNLSNGDGLSAESPAVWTPDSQAVVAPARINGVQGIYILPANGDGSFQRVPTAPGADILCVGSISVVAPLAAGP